MNYLLKSNFCEIRIGSIDKYSFNSFNTVRYHIENFISRHILYPDTPKFLTNAQASTFSYK